MADRNKQWLAVVALALTAAACAPYGDRDGNGDLGAAIGAIAVVEGTVLAVEDGVDGVDMVLVGQPALVADLQRPGLAPRMQSLRDLIGDQSRAGNPLRLRYSEGRYAEGTTYAFFIGAWGPEEFSTLYAHDLATDRPAPPFDRDASANGNKPAEVLECLVTAFGTEGSRRGLDALIEANLEKHSLDAQEIVQPTSFHRCAFDESLSE